MPPKNATSRKGPQFKPPRPVKESAQTKAPTKRAAPAAAKKSVAANARSGFQPSTTIISSDEASDDELDLRDDSDEHMSDAPAPAPRQSVLAPIPPPIPAPLLARLLYENFEDKNTQIQKGAMELTGKYIEIFVREAFARAKQEREKSARGGGISDGFLQIEDLERLAAQLVLDF